MHFVVAINVNGNVFLFAARRMTSPIFTSAEYSQWLTRAPSTSALYDRSRRTTNLRPQLPRSAHSAESLLDRLKQVSVSIKDQIQIVIERGIA